MEGYVCLQARMQGLGANSQKCEKKRKRKIHTEKRGGKRPKEWGSRAQRSEEATETRRERTKGERGGTFAGKEEKDIRSRYPEQRETQRQKGPQKTGRQTPPTTYLHAHTKSRSFWDFLNQAISDESNLEDPNPGFTQD